MIYQYECPNGHITDLDFEFGAAPREVECQCGIMSRKVIGVPLIRFLGPGWPDKEKTHTEAKNEEHARQAEYQRRKAELKQDGVQFKDWGE